MQKLSRLLVRLSAAFFAANVIYFYLLIHFGSKHRNAATGQIVPLVNHGYCVFITNAQHSIWIGSLVVVALLFSIGVITHKKISTKQGP